MHQMKMQLVNVQLVTEQVVNVQLVNVLLVNVESMPQLFPAVKRTSR